MQCRELAVQFMGRGLICLHTAPHAAHCMPPPAPACSCRAGEPSNVPRQWVTLYCTLAICLELTCQPVTKPPCSTPCTEYCARGSLADVLRAAKGAPAKMQHLTWLRRLNMALDATKGMLYL